MLPKVPHFGALQCHASYICHRLLTRLRNGHTHVNPPIVDPVTLDCISYGEKNFCKKKFQKCRMTATQKGSQRQRSGHVSLANVVNQERERFLFKKFLFFRGCRPSLNIRFLDNFFQYLFCVSCRPGANAVKFMLEEFSTTWALPVKVDLFLTYLQTRDTSAALENQLFNFKGLLKICTIEQHLLTIWKLGGGLGIRKYAGNKIWFDSCHTMTS
jgi:hypothetical protein